MHAAQVAMDCLGRMQKVSTRARRGKRSGQFLANEASLAHACDNQVALQRLEQFDCGAEVGVQLFGHLGKRRCLGKHYFASEIDDFF